MRRQIVTTISLLPLLLMLSHAAQTAQRWTVESPEPFGIPSEDSGASSYLGVDIADITSDRLGALKLKEEKGVEVTMVDQDAPAGKVGIKEHDVILTMNGSPVESKTQLHRMIHETPPGRLVTLGISRDGQPMTIQVQLADRSKEWPMEKGVHVQIPSIPSIPPIPSMPDIDVPNISVVYVHSSARSGLMVENLTPQLGEFFGAKDGNGVLVRSVERGSRAEKAGVRAGDVIIRVADQAIHDTSDFSHALHSRGTGSVSVNVLRDKKELTLTLTLPGRKESGEMIEESFDEPEMDAEARDELIEIRDEVAHLRPQMRLAEQEVRQASTEMRKSLCSARQQMHEQAQNLRLQQRDREKLEQQMERLHRQMQGHRLDL